MDYAKIIELTFKIVVILASLGVATALIRKVIGTIKNYLLIERRLTKLEKIIYRNNNHKHKHKNKFKHYEQRRKQK